jgi:hypothetical protein
MDKKKTIIAIVIFLLLSLIVGYLLVTKDIEKEEELTNEETTTIDSNYDWGVDDIGNFVMVVDFELDEPLTIEKVINMDIKIFDNEDNEIYSLYLNSISEG